MTNRPTQAIEQDNATYQPRSHALTTNNVISYHVLCCGGCSLKIILSEFRPWICECVRVACKLFQALTSAAASRKQQIDRFTGRIMHVDFLHGVKMSDVALSCLQQSVCAAHRQALRSLMWERQGSMDWSRGKADSCL